MTEQERWLIVGLGNPGRRHTRNRHNVGFQCLDRLAQAHQLTFDKRQGRARLAMGRIEERPVVLLKPRTFMNESGRAVAPVARFYKVEPSDVVEIIEDSGGQIVGRPVIIQAIRDTFRVGRYEADNVLREAIKQRLVLREKDSSDKRRKIYRCREDEG